MRSLLHIVPLLFALVALLGFAPPSGRPPSGPLARAEPKVYDVGFEVTLSTRLAHNAGHQEIFSLQNTPIVMPVIYQSTFSRVDPESLSARLWYGAMEDATLRERSKVDSGLPFGTHLAVINIPSFEGQILRWRVGFRSMVWSSRLDEAGAARITWPREWPDEVKDGLQPQTFIESGDPLFAETVQRVSGGNLRMVPPWLAAKDLVRYCVNEIQVVGDGEDRRELRLLHGLEMQGALATARSGRGGPHDLVCVCVAMLRAAGIPARPVIGIHEDARGVTRFVSWAELYLPGAEWIPFDPDEMRGKGVRHRDVREPWPEFGTMDELNERVPLAFHFIPAATVQTPQAPAVWGWDPRPSATRAAEQFINLSLTSRTGASTGGRQTGER